MKRWICLAGIACAGLQASDIGRAPLIFREDWTASPPAIPLTQRDVSNPDLHVALHGPGPPLVKKSFHDARDWDPHYVWSGLSKVPWAVSLSLADGGLMDLSGTATVRWRSRQSGFRQLRAVIELAGGEWLVSEQSDGASQQWRTSEFAFSATRWRELDPAAVTEGPWAEAPDLTRVRSVGFTDLMPGGRSAACSRLDWIEVYGQRIPTGPLEVFVLSGQSNMVGWGNSMELDSVARFGHDRRLEMFHNGEWLPLQPRRPASKAQREGWDIREFTFGPEIGFAHALAKAWPGRRIGIVKQAIGGTGIMAWAPEWNAADADLTGDARKGPLYEELLADVRAAMAGRDARLSGFLWLQGANDMNKLSTARRYGENLRTLITALRRDLEAPDLPVLVGTYRFGTMPDELDGFDPGGLELSTRRPGAWDVLQAQYRVPKKVGRAAPVYLRDMPTHPNNIHANTAGMLQAGRAYARVYLDLFAGEE